MSEQALVGKVFGRLTARKFAGKDRFGQTAWEFQCSCGNKKIIRLTRVRHGLIKSCGCLMRETRIANGFKHGKAYSAVYKSWQAMKTRCLSSRDSVHRCYGGRGITVCERWESFENFYEDMGDPPHGFSIERIDNNKGYSKDNCKWATVEEQSRNRRTTVKIEIEGEVRALKEWAEIYRIPYDRVCYRIRKGWEPVTALTTPKYTNRYY